MTRANRRGKAGVLRQALAVALVALGALAMTVDAAAVERTEELVITSEIEGRQVVLPTDLPMDLLWYSPAVGLEGGRIVRGWVMAEVVLLETDKNYLICVQRENGTEKWRCVLEDKVRYEPSVSRNNVVVNVNNILVGIDKRVGEIRWRLKPTFVMSNGPVIVDPAAYPKAYTKEWKNLEHVYVASWQGRLHSMLVRGRITTFYRGKDDDSSLAAPDFDLFYPWHKTLGSRGIISTPLNTLEDIMYYSADDKNVYAVTRDGEEREPYTMQGEPCTPLTITLATCYVGCRDFSLYALDRLTLRKKWTYPCGAMPFGRVYSDEPAEHTFVFFPTAADGVHALKVQSARGGGPKDLMQVPESFEVAWKVPLAQGAIGASQTHVYLGYDLAKDFSGYRQAAAVEKASGKVAWKSESKGVRFFLEFQNAWRNPEQHLRLYAVTEDNRLVALKEKATEAGPLKLPKKPVEAPKEVKKVPGQAQAKVEGKTEEAAPEKKEEK